MIEPSPDPKPFDRYWVWCSVVACSLMMTASLVGLFDGWPWWLWLPMCLAVGILASEVADALSARADARASADRETPP